MPGTWPSREEFERLAPSEKILLLQELWDGIAESGDQPVLTDTQRAELDRRINEHERDSDSAVPWDQARARLQSTRGADESK